MSAAAASIVVMVMLVIAATAIMIAATASVVMIATSVTTAAASASHVLDKVLNLLLSLQQQLLTCRTTHPLPLQLFPSEYQSCASFVMKFCRDEKTLSFSQIITGHFFRSPVRQIVDSGREPKFRPLHFFPC